MNSAQKIRTVKEFLDSELSKTEKRAQFKNGQVSLKLMPSSQHGKVQLAASVEIVNKFRKPNTPGGGWWFRTETSIECQKSSAIVTPDISGWKRQNCTIEPMGYPVTQRPDWVCEVAFSTLQVDIREAKLIYEKECIPFYWVMDVANERLIVFELLEQKLIQTQELFAGDGEIEVPPFFGDKLNISELFGIET